MNFSSTFLKRLESRHHSSHDICIKEKIKILSLHGGGVKGYITSLILKDIEEYTGKNIQDLFDFSIGTSIGGILSLALSLSSKDGDGYKFKAKDFPSFFENNASTIFPILSKKYFKGLYQGFIGELYTRDGIDSFLQQEFEEYRFNDTVFPTTVLSYSESKNSFRTNGPTVWSSFATENNLLLSDVAGFTSAAPTYFPPKASKDYKCIHECFKINSLKHKTYMSVEKLEMINKNCDDECKNYNIDGGIFANDPSMLAISMVKKLCPNYDINNIYMVSIGTGHYYGINDKLSFAKTGSLKEYLFADFSEDPSGLLTIIFKAIENYNYLNTDFLLGKNFIHINPIIDSAINKLDDSSIDNLMKIRIFMDSFLHTEKISGGIYNLRECLLKNFDSPDCVDAYDNFKSSEMNHNFDTSLVEFLA